MVQLLDAPETIADERPDAPPFGVVVDTVCRRLGPALALSVDDTELGERALRRTLARTPGVRSSKAALDEDPALIDAHRRAFTWLTTARWPRSVPVASGSRVIVAPAGAASATTDLCEALATLPLRQRNTLVCEVLLGWDRHTIADAQTVPPRTVDLRSDRAWGELAKVLERPRSDVEAAVHALLPRLAGSVPPADIEPNEIVRVARLRRLRLQLAAIAGALLAIVVVASFVRAFTVVDQATTAGPDTAATPRASEPPFAPIGDGAGGFVALRPGAYDLLVSDDGTDWFEQARLNVNEIDLRIYVERIFRSDDRFVALVESSTGGSRSLSGSDRPRVAVGESLDDWRFVPVSVDARPEVNGLRANVDLLNAALVGDRILLAVEIDHTVDYIGQPIGRSQTCAVANDAEGVVLHGCDGRSAVLADPAERDETGLDSTYRLLASDGFGDFVELTPDIEINPFSLFSFDGRFAMLDESTRTLFVSDDGVAWRPLLDLGIDNRLGLVAASGDAAVAIAPSSEGWVSYLLADDQVTEGRLPLDLDPTTVWLKPVLVQGPAGYALFLTTSRPWARGDDAAFGWAVHDGDWLVERKADTGTIRARSTTTGERYDYENLSGRRGAPLPHPFVERGLFGGVRLLRPGTDTLLAEVTSERIRESWVTGEAATEPPIASVPFAGFVIEGNLRTGPLRLLDERGLTIGEWRNGFDFTNGDIGDGVESNLFEGATDPSIDFFGPDGEVLVSVPIEALDPLDLAPSERDGDRIKAVVVHSPDGITWQVVWESSRDTWYGSVAVGDEEVLISVAGIAADPERVVVAPG